MTNDCVYQVSDEDFILAIKLSKNIHEALVKMGLNSRGNSYVVFKRRCKSLGVNLNHFTTDKELKKKMDDNHIITVCKDSLSIQMVLKKLGLNPHTGANRLWINKKISVLGIDTSSWLGRAHLKGSTHNWNGIPLERVLVENSSYNSTHLKSRLVKEGLLEYKCYNCGLVEWLGKPISLQLEHKNGVHSDNRLDNLELLCPNCHSQTKTFCRKKK